MASRQNKAETTRLVERSACLFFFIVSCPVPIPAKATTNQRIFQHPPTTLPLPPLTCFDAEAPPSHFKKKKRKMSKRSRPRKFKKKKKKKKSVGRHREDCWRRPSQTKWVASKRLSDLLRFQRQRSCQRVCGARHHCHCCHDTIARFIR